MKSSSFFAILFTFSFLFIACEHTTKPQSHTGEVVVRSASSKLHITNKTDAPIYYFVVGRVSAASINWVAFSNVSNRIVKDSTMSIPYNDIYRGEHEKEVIVHWWHAARPGTAARGDEIHGIVVEL